MNVIDNDSAKGEHLKCAKEYKGLIPSLDTEDVTKVCNVALDRIEELEKENAILSGEAEPLLDDSRCPDVFCEDCTKKDCELKKLGLVGDNS